MFFQRGVIKILNISNKEKEIIKYILKPSNIFSQLSLLDYEENLHEIAVALENCEVCFIPTETLKELMVTDQVFRKDIHQSIGKRIKKMEEQMFSLMLKDGKERILNFLKEFV